MASIKMTPDQVGITIRETAKNIPVAAEAASMLASQRALSHLKSISPVDRGMFKNAWMARRARMPGWSLPGWVVQNSAPYAGIIEAGARPHPVSAEGWMAIFRWVLRHPELMKFESEVGKKWAKDAQKVVSGGGTKDPRAAAWGGKKSYKGTTNVMIRRATEITNAIVWKLKKEGQKGLFLVRDNMTKFQFWLVSEINRIMKNYLAKGKGGKP